MRLLPIILVANLGSLLSIAGSYDSTRQIRLRGPVTRIEWSNPRAYIFLNVHDASGITTNWAVDIGNPLDLQAEGWKVSAVHIGDVVTVDGSPAQGSSRRAVAKSVLLDRTGMKLFAALKKAMPKAAVEPTPRWPDGHPRLGAPPGRKGYWGAASASSLIENQATKIPMNADGLLVNLADSGRVAPFQPWAQVVYEYRQRTLLKDDPLSRCLPPGGPRQFQTPHGFQFLEQPELGRILVLLGGGDRNWRVIYTDGRPLSQADEAVRGYYGTSVGHWEKDVLVVESTGFNERFWMANGGLPHTEALHLTERFSRPDLNTLKYEVTVDDPRTYTRSWNSGWTVQWVPNQEIEEYFCEDNAETTFVR